MTPTTPGSCAKCDTPVYEIAYRDAETGVPRRLGRPLEAARSATFVLMNGSQMSLCMCAGCVETLQPKDFAWLWQRELVSWAAQGEGGVAWARTQSRNGILGLLGVKSVRRAA